MFSCETNIVRLCRHPCSHISPWMHFNEHKIHISAATMRWRQCTLKRPHLNVCTYETRCRLRWRSFWICITSLFQEWSTSVIKKPTIRSFCLEHSPLTEVFFPNIWVQHLTDWDDVSFILVFFEFSFEKEFLELI